MIYLQSFSKATLAIYMKLFALSDETLEQFLYLKCVKKFADFQDVRTVNGVENLFISGNYLILLLTEENH